MSAESERKPSYTHVGLSFFDEELETVRQAQARGDGFGVRLDRSKAIRLLLRYVDVEKIPYDAFREIANEVSRRRKTLKG